MPTKDYPSAAFLRQSLREEDGKLYWLVRPLRHFVDSRACGIWNGRFSGKEAGTLCKTSPTCVKWLIMISYKRHPRSHIIWVLRTGNWPKQQIDHKNRNSLDDRFENLRLATQMQNSANKGKSRINTSGFKGVWGCPRVKKTKWGARIRVNGEPVHLGYYDTREEAHAAYVAAARWHFGEFACEG